MEIPPNASKDSLRDALERVEAILRYYERPEVSMAPLEALIGDVELQVREALGAGPPKEALTLDALRHANRSIAWRFGDRD